jgi:hypothetical protein
MNLKGSLTGKPGVKVSGCTLQSSRIISNDGL